MPTILEAAHIKAPASVDGVTQLPMDGTSLVASFSSADAPEKHRTQYFEVFGNRAIYHDGWMASAFHGGLPWTVGLRDQGRDFSADPWERDTRDGIAVSAATRERHSIQSVTIMVHRGSPRPGHDYPNRTEFSIMC